MAHRATAIALYGAGLSSYNIWIARKDKKPKLKVTARIAQTISATNDVGEPEFKLLAANIGQASVSVATCGLRLPDKTELRVLLSYYPSENELASGKAFHARAEPFRIAREARERGFKGNIKLRPFFADEIGRYFWGKPITLDVDSYTLTLQNVVKKLNQAILHRDANGNLVFNDPILSFDNMLEVTQLSRSELEEIIVANSDTFRVVQFRGTGYDSIQYFIPRESDAVAAINSKTA